MDKYIRDNAGNIIDSALVAPTIAKEAAIEAAKLPACTALKIIPVAGAAAGATIDVVVGQEGVEQAVTSQLYAMLASSGVTGVLVVAAGPNPAAWTVLAIAAFGYGTYYLSDKAIDVMFSATESLAIYMADKISKLMGVASSIPSPIVFDLNGDGVTTSSLISGAYFDHAGDGFAEQTAWVSPEDGLLVRDLNGNGTIDTGAELFGDNTLLATGQKAANGFLALADLDSNKDGKIDALDAAFSELQVWKDADGNGITSAGELHSLAEMGVASISTAFTASGTVDANGNSHSQIGSYTTTDGTTRAATDVWFKTDSLYSFATEILDIPEDILNLPEISGYGHVRSLQQAMGRDATPDYSYTSSL